MIDEKLAWYEMLEVYRNGDQQELAELGEVFHFSEPEYVGEMPEAPSFTVTNVEDQMNAGNDLQVKVDTKKVLGMVKENRDKHKKDYAEALKGWIEDLKKETARAAREAKKLTVEETLKEGASNCYQDVHVSLPPPRQFLNEYDQVIGMLEVCVEDELTLTGKQINAWCHDRWQWKDDFVTSNAAYMCR